MPATDAQAVETFARVLGATGGTVERVSTGAEAAKLIARTASELGARSVLYQGSEAIEALQLKFPLAAQGIELLPVDKAGERISEQTVALTGARFAIAETGTLALGGTPGGWGLASALPWVHFVVLRAEDVVTDLSTAYRRFAARLAAGERDWVWITGPSRTADIGHTLVLGAHGPNALVVMVLP